MLYMIRNASDLYDFIQSNSNIVDDVKSATPTPIADETLERYTQRLTAVRGLAPYVIFQEEIKHVIPLDSEMDDYANVVKKYLEGRKEITRQIPEKKAGQSAQEYFDTLKSIPFVQQYWPFEEHIPRVQYRKKRSLWQNRLNGIKALKTKMQSPELQLVQMKDGSYCPKNIRELLSDSQFQCYKKCNDLSLSMLLGDLIDEAITISLEGVDEELSVKGMGDILKREIVDLAVKNLPLLSHDPTLFSEALTRDIEQISLGEEKEYESSLIQMALASLARDITTKFHEISEVQLAAYDASILRQNLSPGYLARQPGVTFLEPKEAKTRNGVVITTSNGGGCHKNIARTISETLMEEGYPCAIINESEQNGVDPLEQFLGIPHSDLYPVVFQQLGQEECCNTIKDIDKVFNREFLPPFKFSLLRNAIERCSGEFKIDTVYSTQHYATDLRVAPKGSTVIFQVCDYGHIGKLEELGNLIVNMDANSKVKFLIPSNTCLGAIKNQEAKQALERTFVESIYPTRILSEEDTERHFNEFIAQESLFPPEEDVLRCTLVMGGQGCGDLIEAYIDKLFAEIEQNNIGADEKFELVVACGNNQELREALNSQYAEKLSALPDNIKIKFCGRIDNAQLIAYNKNGVLITKPGGGTVAESVENHIQTLVHYNKKMPWERGNAEEIPKRGLGKIFAGHIEAGEDAPEVQISSLNLVQEIKTATENRKVKRAELEALNRAVEQEIETIEQNLCLMFDSQSPSLLHQSQEFQESPLAAHVNDIITRLNGIKGQALSSQVVRYEIHMLKKMHQEYKAQLAKSSAKSNVGTPTSPDAQLLEEHMKALEQFIEKNAQMSSDLAIAPDIIETASKRRPVK